MKALVKSEIIKRVSSVVGQSVERWSIGVPAGRRVTVIVEPRTRSAPPLGMTWAARNIPVSHATARAGGQAARFYSNAAGRIEICVSNPASHAASYELKVRCS